MVYAHLSQILEHRRPSLRRNIVVRHGQRFAPPRVVLNASGGLVVKEQLGKLGVLQGARDEATSDRNRYVVANL